MFRFSENIFEDTVSDLIAGKEAEGVKKFEFEFSNILKPKLYLFL